jgi:hypothetical protein
MLRIGHMVLLHLILVTSATLFITAAAIVKEGVFVSTLMNTFEDITLGIGTSTTLLVVGGSTLLMRTAVCVAWYSVPTTSRQQALLLAYVMVALGFVAGCLCSTCNPDQAQLCHVTMCSTVAACNIVYFAAIFFVIQMWHAYIIANALISVVLLSGFVVVCLLPSECMQPHAHVMQYCLVWSNLLSEYVLVYFFKQRLQSPQFALLKLVF